MKGAHSGQKQAFTGKQARPGRTLSATRLVFVNLNQPTAVASSIPPSARAPGGAASRRCGAQRPAGAQLACGKRQCCRSAILPHRVADNAAVTHPKLQANPYPGPSTTLSGHA